MEETTHIDEILNFEKERRQKRLKNKDKKVKERKFIEKRKEREWERKLSKKIK